MANAAGRFSDIEFRNEVADLHIVAERLEAVREAPWDIQLPTIGIRQLERLPVPVSRRTRSDVDDHIPYGALEAPHKLHFAVRLALIMHATHGADAR